MPLAIRGAISWLSKKGKTTGSNGGFQLTMARNSPGKSGWARRMACTASTAPALAAQGAMGASRPTRFIGLWPVGAHGPQQRPPAGTACRCSIRGRGYWRRRLARAARGVSIFAPAICLAAQPGQWASQVFQTPRAVQDPKRRAALAPASADVLDGGARSRPRKAIGRFGCRWHPEKPRRCRCGPGFGLRSTVQQVVTQLLPAPFPGCTRC